MISFSSSTLASLAKEVRGGNPEEVLALAQAAVADLGIAGVYVVDEKDSLTYQAVRLYCKAHYGYDSENDTRRFLEGYKSLKTSMALCGDYDRKDDVSG